MTVRQVLVVEDHEDIARLIQIHLEDLDCHVVRVADGRDALKQVAANKFDLVILDLMLPGIDGLEVCRQVRSQPFYIPIIMLTARSSELDRILGLDLGADDYVTKPFSYRELMARVKAQLRRVEVLADGSARPASKQEYGPLSIDVEKRTVAINRQPVELTAKEFDLLLQFTNHPGRVYSRAQLLDKVWGFGHDGYEHTVNSHINRLRGKIEQDPAHPEYILTVWGVGYKFNDHIIEARV
jgi:DNA-binding response OmpR family regulator